MERLNNKLISNLSEKHLIKLKEQYAKHRIDKDIVLKIMKKGFSLREIRDQIKYKESQVN